MVAARIVSSSMDESKKPYNLKITKCGNYIRVEISGHRAFGKEASLAKEALSVIAAECRESGLKRVLGVGRLTGMLPIFSVFDIAKDPASFGWDRSVRFAYVDLSDESRDNLALSQTFAANRGYTFFRVFAKERDALDWLLKV